MLFYFGRSMTSDRAYYHGQYYAKGDIVSVEDIDGGIYYAQVPVVNPH
jgi:hypothetical protein